MPTCEMPAWGSSEQRSILEVLARRLNDDPAGSYLDFPDRSYTAEEMAVEAGRAASVLAELGVGKGDRVATLLDNCPAAVSVWFGALQLGAIPVPINAANRGEFLRHPLVDSGSVVLLVHDHFADRVEAIIGSVEDLQHVIVHTRGPDRVDASPRVENFEARGRVQVWDWATMMTGAAPLPLDPGVTGPGDLATLIYTAGTTGPSKACMLSHNYVVNACSRTAPAWGRSSADVMWTPLPLFHFAAYQHVVVGTLVVGGSGGIGDRFSVSRFWDEVHRTGATMVALLGSMTTMLARAESSDHEIEHALRLVIAVPSLPEIERIWKERFGVETFSGGYALTEGGPLSLVAPGQANKPGAAGVAQTPDFDTRIFDDQDREVGPGVVGEIVTRPRHPHVMFEGYWGRPEDSLRALGGLWFHTGDLGRIDEDGFLYFVDRKKDCLRRRGENISSYEVEAAFRQHPAVLDVAAHAVASTVAEDEVKVTIVLRPDAASTERELCEWSLDKLPYFAVPRYVELRNELPRNPVGRVTKHILRDQGVTPTTWDRDNSDLHFDRN